MVTTSLTLGDAILALTLLAVALQAYYARKTLDAFILQSRYLMFFELDKLLVENPRLQLLISREDVGTTLKGANDQRLKQKSFIELSLDLAEFNFLSSSGGHRRYFVEYLKTLATNPHVRAYWQSDARGSFDPKFVRFLDDLMRRTAKQTS